MKSAKFDYVVAESVAEAATALASAGTSPAIIAGGQSLVPMLNLRVAVADVLVDISGIAELKSTSETATGIRIGALTTHADIEDGKIPDLFGGLMRKVASGISYRSIRNYGTVGGSVALADPAADWPVCFMALGANVCIASGEAARSQPITDFIEGQYATSLRKNEIIIGLDVPRSKPTLRWGLHKVVRKSGAFADSMAIAAQRDHEATSIALGGAVPRPFLLTETARQLGHDGTSESELRAAIVQDLKANVPQDDTYLLRLHTSTVMRAVREMLGS
jgi:carbon-monoxide dehydrogenase medium subunit